MNNASSRTAASNASEGRRPGALAHRFLKTASGPSNGVYGADALADFRAFASEYAALLARAEAADELVESLHAQLAALDKVAEAAESAAREAKMERDDALQSLQDASAEVAGLHKYVDSLEVMVKRADHAEALAGALDDACAFARGARDEDEGEDAARLAEWTAALAAYREGQK